MAYNFLAESRVGKDLKIIHKHLTQFDLVEFFPVEVTDNSIALGISIPFKAMDDPRFEIELEGVMKYLILEQEFQVTDLFRGSPVRPFDIAGLAKKISA